MRGSANANKPAASPRRTSASIGGSSAGSSSKKKPLPLADCICLVDTYTSDGLDASVGHVKVLKALGATVSDTLSENLTHLVSSNSNAKRVGAAMLMGICVVSPLWIEQCRESGTRAPETDFLVTPAMTGMVSAPLQPPPLPREPQANLASTRRSLDSPFFSSSQREDIPVNVPKRGGAANGNGAKKSKEKQQPAAAPARVPTPVHAPVVAVVPVAVPVPMAIPIPNFRHYELPPPPPERKRRRRSERISDMKEDTSSSSGSDDDDDDDVPADSATHDSGRNKREQLQKKRTAESVASTESAIDPSEVLPVVNEWPPTDELIARKFRMPRIDVDEMRRKTLSGPINNSSSSSSKKGQQKAGKDTDKKDSNSNPKPSSSNASIKTNDKSKGKSTLPPPPPRQPSGGASMKSSAAGSNVVVKKISKKSRYLELQEEYERFAEADGFSDADDGSPALSLGLSGFLDKGEERTVRAILQTVAKSIRQSAATSGSSALSVSTRAQGGSALGIHEDAKVRLLVDSDDPDPMCCECKFLVAPMGCQRTLKIIFAMARGVPVVLPDWANYCLSAEKWVDPTPYLHPAYNTSLKTLLEPNRRSQSTLFRTVVAYVGPCTVPNVTREMLVILLETIGAIITEDINTATCLVFGLPKDAQAWYQRMQADEASTANSRQRNSIRQLLDKADGLAINRLAFTSKYVFNCIEEQILRHGQDTDECIKFKSVAKPKHTSPSPKRPLQASADLCVGSLSLSSSSSSSSLTVSKQKPKPSPKPNVHTNDGSGSDDAQEAEPAKSARKRSRSTDDSLLPNKRGKGDSADSVVGRLNAPLVPKGAPLTPISAGSGQNKSTTPVPASSRVTRSGTPSKAAAVSDGLIRGTRASPAANKPPSLPLPTIRNSKASSAIAVANVSEIAVNGSKAVNKGKRKSAPIRLSTAQQMAHGSPVPSPVKHSRSPAAITTVGSQKLKSPAASAGSSNKNSNISAKKAGAPATKKVAILDEEEWTDSDVPTATHTSSNSSSHSNLKSSQLSTNTNSAVNALIGIRQSNAAQQQQSKVSGGKGASPSVSKALTSAVVAIAPKRRLVKTNVLKGKTGGESDSDSDSLGSAGDVSEVESGKHFPAVIEYRHSIKAGSPNGRVGRADSPSW